MRGPLSHLGRYRILEKVASGGMASVYRARIEQPPGLSAVIALKVLHPHLSDDVDAVAMFLHEARLGARFEHRNLIHVIDSGRIDGYRYIAMPYFASVTLAQLVDGLSGMKERIGTEWAVWVLREILHGLAFAHELTDDDGRPLGVVHRDVSPDNVLISESGEVKLLDFGIAKAPSPRPLSEAGVTKGKAAYMAPEQIDGRTVDARADLYSAALVGYELLAGKPLFGPKTRSTENAAALVFRRVKGPARLRASLARALASDPEERYPDADVFSDALSQVLAEMEWEPEVWELGRLVGEMREEVLRPPGAHDDEPPTARMATGARTRRATALSAAAKRSVGMLHDPTSAEERAAEAPQQPDGPDAALAPYGTMALDDTVPGAQFARWLAWVAFALFLAGLILEVFGVAPR